MIAAGFYALSKRTGHVVQVIESTPLWGIITCKVYDTVTGEVLTLREDELTVTAQPHVTPDSFVRFAAAWCRVQNELAHGLVFDVSESVVPLPHQQYCVERATAGGVVRFMLADEVGLGKTIEAGLIIKELKERGLIERVLVVCPVGLTTQWEAEMLTKFGERFIVVTPDDYDTLNKLHPGGSPFTQFDRVISPMDAIKPLESRAGWSEERVAQYNHDRIEAVLGGGWDLIIIDEAHRVAGSTSDVARHKLGTLLSAVSPNLLLLTATPHSGKTEPFLRLMQLLDKNAFPNTKAVVRQQVAPYLIRTEKREAVDNEGQPLFKARHTRLTEVAWEARHLLQQQLYEDVTEYVRTGYNKAMREKKAYIGFLMILFQRLVSSSTDAIIDALQRRLHALGSQGDQLRSVSIEDMIGAESEEALGEALLSMSLGIRQETEQLEKLLMLARNAKVQCMDAKAERLMALLERIHREEPGAKIILFTEFVATQKALEQLCVYHGLTTTLINGSMNIEERNASLRRFRQDKTVLISTDAGGEGLNLQCAHIVVNYDLPWNPMKIEQRIGRADRIGQTRDVIVYNFILSDTIENRVRSVLEEKLAVIFKELGIDKLQDVLDSDSADMDFTKVYMKTIVEPQYVQSFASALGNDVGQQVRQAMEIRGVIRDEKTLRPDLELSRRRQGFHAILRSMLKAYYCAQHMEYDALLDLELSVSDQRIQDLLATRQIWHPKQGAPSVHIDGLNAENGWWMLWELALGDDKQDKRILSIFINDAGVYRPAASKLIWDEVLRGQKSLSMRPDSPLTETVLSELSRRAMDIAEDAFVSMRGDYHKRHEGEYRKRKYALTLRLDAAERIGIDNIRMSRKRRLHNELNALEAFYEQKQAICPTFRPMLICAVRAYDTR